MFKMIHLKYVITAACVLHNITIEHDVIPGEDMVEELVAQDEQLNENNEIVDRTAEI